MKNRIYVVLMLSLTALFNRLALAFVLKSKNSCHHRCYPSCISNHQQQLQQQQQLSLSAIPSDKRNFNEDEYQDALARNKKRTDVRLFLTQRAIQSFIHLLLETRDPHTVRWIETNYEAPNLDSFHGTAAFNYTKWGQWDSVLLDMLSKPQDVVVVCAKRRGRPNNPYFEDHVVEFEIDINPTSLVSRIVSVRDQIAKEWLSDLDTLIVANDVILSSYNANMASSRAEEECSTPLDGEENEACIQSSEQLADMASGSGSRHGGGESSRNVFDRTAQLMLTHTMAFEEVASSPIRKRSLDLLQLLATQESVHRVLRQYRDSRDERRVSLEWLRDFYVSRVANFFDGSVPPGKADDFLEQLLLLPPSMKTTADQQLELVDPLRIAEDIIHTRANVCADWKEIIKNVPLDHMELRKHILARQMGKPLSPSIFAANGKASSDSISGGEFE